MLSKNYAGEPKWVLATTIAQTGPVSYTVQTGDSVWRKDVDQVLSAPPVPEELSTEGQTDAQINLSVPLHTKVQHPASETSGQTTKETADKAETSVQLSPKDILHFIFSAERRYPTREQRPPARLTL